jgi:hypothetical protein
MGFLAGAIHQDEISPALKPESILIIRIAGTLSFPAA